MGNQVTIEDDVHGEFAEIQFQDEGETVGVSHTTLRFLERFTGHVSHLQLQLLGTDISPRRVHLEIRPS